MTDQIILNCNLHNWFTASKQCLNRGNFILVKDNWVAYFQNSLILKFPKLSYWFYDVLLAILYSMVFFCFKISSKQLKMHSKVLKCVF